MAGTFWSVASLARPLRVNPFPSWSSHVVPVFPSLPVWSHCALTHTYAGDETRRESTDGRFVFWMYLMWMWKWRTHTVTREVREKKMSKVTKGCHVLDFQKSNHVRIARAYTDRCVIPSLAAGEFVLWCLLTARTPLLCCSEEAEIQTLRFPGSFSSTAQEQAATPRCWCWSC